MASYEYPCEECGDMMTAMRRDKRFCSPSCMRKSCRVRLKAEPERYAAWQERKRQEYLKHRDRYLDGAKRQRERQRAQGYYPPAGCNWEELFAQFWNGRCYLCGDSLDRDDCHLDHDHSCCPLGRSCEKCRRGFSHP